MTVKFQLLQFPFGLIMQLAHHLAFVLKLQNIWWGKKSVNKWAAEEAGE
ncbi:hypothetical protein [Chroogloeocystis siderophila]|nr:hypothetical protein [Chroogloeocystis siderophila]